MSRPTTLWEHTALPIVPQPFTRIKGSFVRTMQERYERAESDREVNAVTRSMTAARVAGVIVLLEAAGLGALAAWEAVAVIAGDTAALDSAIALVVLTLAGAAIVAVFGITTWRGLSWGRSGAIVTQLLILAVALGAATGQYAHPVTGVVIAIPAIVALVLLVIAVRSAAPPARED